MTDHHETIKRLFADYAAEQKRLDEAGDPEAHLKWAFAEAFLDTLKAGYQITDFSCFRHHPLYTGDRLSDGAGAENNGAHGDMPADQQDGFLQFRRQTAGVFGHPSGVAAD